MLWVLTYISLACYIVWTPFSIAWEMDKAFRTDGSNNKSFDYMFAGLITAVGAWGASVALKTSTDKLIGFFDVQKSDVGTYYQAQMSKSASWDNFVPIVVDLTHHGLTLFTYWVLAGAMSYGSYRYAYYYITAPGTSFSLM
jgi:F0F1-type ATP synthase membrane subunit c/vacuolar-type H+-ATPase subunit K